MAEASCCAAVRIASTLGGPGFFPDRTVLNTPLSMADCTVSTGMVSNLATDWN